MGPFAKLQCKVEVFQNYLAQWVKILATSPDDLVLILEFLIMEEEGGLDTQHEKDFQGQQSNLQIASSLLKIKEGTQLWRVKTLLWCVLVNISAIVTKYPRMTKRGPILAPTMVTW